MNLEERLRLVLENEFSLDEGERITAITTEKCGCYKEGGKCQVCDGKRFVFGAVTIWGNNE